MNNFNFMLAKHYDVDYLLTTSIIKNGNFVSCKTPLTLKNVMFWKSTEHFYIFYAKDNDKCIKIKKSNIISAKEL